MLRITTYVENRRIWGRKSMTVQCRIYKNRGASGIDGPSRRLGVPEMAVDGPSGGERTFRGRRVRTAGRYVLQRNTRRRKGHKQQMGMSGNRGLFEARDVRKRLSFASNEQKTSIAANKRGTPSDKVSVGGLDKATVGELEPSLCREDLPGRKPTTTTGVETAKPRAFQKAVAPPDPVSSILTLSRPKYM